MKKTDRNPKAFFNLANIFLIFCFVLVSILLINTFQMKNVSTYLLPRLLSLFCLITISVSLIIEFFKGGRPSDGKEEKDAPQGLNVFFAIFFAGVYFVLIFLLGFVLTTFAAVIAFSYMLGFKTKKVIFPVAVILPVSFYYLFVRLLQVKLPGGFLESIIFF